MTSSELRAEIGRLEALLKAQQAEEVKAGEVIKAPLEAIKRYLPPQVVAEVLGHACSNCSGDGRLEQGHGSGKWVRCQVCKGTGAA